MAYLIRIFFAKKQPESINTVFFSDVQILVTIATYYEIRIFFSHL